MNLRGGGSGGFELGINGGSNEIQVLLQFIESPTEGVNGGGERAELFNGLENLW